MSTELNYGQEKRNDSRSIEELVRLALTEQDEEASREAVTVLHCKGSREVLEAATRLCASDSADERQLGANILGQLGMPDRTFPDECFERLAAMLTKETDPNVLECIGVAFSHLKDPRAIELLLPLKRHANSDVRFGVALGLTGHDRPDAIEALIELSRDSEELVRTWATFTLGTMISADTPAYVGIPNDVSIGGSATQAAFRCDFGFREEFIPKVLKGENVFMQGGGSYPVGI
jgi:HEAT repeat protein